MLLQEESIKTQVAYFVNLIPESVQHREEETNLHMRGDILS